MWGIIIPEYQVAVSNRQVVAVGRPISWSAHFLPEQRAAAAVFVLSLALSCLYVPEAKSTWFEAGYCLLLFFFCGSLPWFDRSTAMMMIHVLVYIYKNPENAYSLVSATMKKKQHQAPLNNLLCVHTPPPSFCSIAAISHHRQSTTIMCSWPSCKLRIYFSYVRTYDY